MRAITLLMLTILVYNVNGQNTDVNELFDNQDTRMEIYNAIASDKQMMMDFMEVAKRNKNSTMMMSNSENNQMKKVSYKPSNMMEMKSEHQMMGMMKDNPEMMQKMMDMCKKNPDMCYDMINMISENPEMMKMCMHKMKQEGKINLDEKIKSINEKGKLKPNEKMMNSQTLYNRNNRDKRDF